jgi:hypothetical protein
MERVELSPSGLFTFVDAEGHFEQEVKFRMNLVSTAGRH